MNITTVIEGGVEIVTPVKRSTDVATARLAGEALTKTLPILIECLRGGTPASLSMQIDWINQNKIVGSRCHASRLTDDNSGDNWSDKTYLPGSATVGTVSDLAHDGNTKTLRILFQPHNAEALVPFTYAESVDLIIDGDVLELHTPNVGSRALRTLTMLRTGRAA